MAAFNMEDFNEILEKSKDQSQQQKQDQVNMKLIFIVFFCYFYINLCDDSQNHDF